jgi:hypothetical protein
MTKIVTFGLGGFCENCDETHDHPLNNIVEEYEIDVPQQPLEGVEVLATLNAVLGIWSLQDAANAVKLTQAELIAEAQAWAAATQ